MFTKMMALGRHVLGFSSDGKLFALINDQGILRIWDTQTNQLKQEYTPNLHLSGPCTALLWIVTTTEHQVKKLKKSNSVHESESIILGTSDGKLSLYSYATAKVERTFKGEGHSGKITAITQDANGNLYTCGDDCQVVVWSMAKEKSLTSWSLGQDKPYSLCHLPNSNSLAIGARRVKVYSVETQELLESFTGHTADIHLMSSYVTRGSKEYVLTSSQMERVVCVWRITQKGQDKLAKCTLLMEDIANCFSCCTDSDGNLRVACVTRSGVIHLYIVSIKTAQVDKPLKPNLTIGIASEDASVIAPISAVSVTLNHSDSQEKVLLGYGDKNVVVFEQVTPKLDEKMQVLVRTDPKKLYTLKSAKGAGASGVTMLSVTPIVNENDVDYQAATVSKKKLKSTDLPMEIRLQNLNLMPVGSSTGPAGQSKAQLLVQALHSQDRQLLRQVLATSDKKTIQLTVQKMPVQYMDNLLKELAIMMEQKQSNVIYSLNWQKTLVQTHCSQLMALGANDLFDKFGPTVGIILHRSYCLQELSILSGRLKSLVGQIKRSVEDPNLNIENALVYEDRDSSSSDVEGMLNGEASDEEWEEDADSESDEEEEVENMDADDASKADENEDDEMDLELDL